MQCSALCKLVRRLRLPAVNMPSLCNACLHLRYVGMFGALFCFMTRPSTLSPAGGKASAMQARMLAASSATPTQSWQCGGGSWGPSRPSSGAMATWTPRGASPGCLGSPTPPACAPPSASATPCCPTCTPSSGRPTRTACPSCGPSGARPLARPLRCDQPFPSEERLILASSSPRLNELGLCTSVQWPGQPKMECVQLTAAAGSCRKRVGSGTFLPAILPEMASAAMPFGRCACSTLCWRMQV